MLERVPCGKSLFGCGTVTKPGFCEWIKMVMAAGDSL
jgi:hypothetical protein